MPSFFICILIFNMHSSISPWILNGIKRRIYAFKQSPVTLHPSRAVRPFLLYSFFYGLKNVPPVSLGRFGRIAYS